MSYSKTSLALAAIVCWGTGSSEAKASNSEVGQLFSCKLVSVGSDKPQNFDCGLNEKKFGSSLFYLLVPGDGPEQVEPNIRGVRYKFDDGSHSGLEATKAVGGSRTIGAVFSKDGLEKFHIFLEVGAYRPGQWSGLVFDQTSTYDATCSVEVSQYAAEKFGALR